MKVLEFSYSILALLVLANGQSVLCQSTGSISPDRSGVAVHGLSAKRSLGVERRFNLGSSTTTRRHDEKGRVTKVVEPDASGKPAFTTDIDYDDFGKVVAIRQHGAKDDAVRERTFRYDSNHQLVSTTNPESGTTTFTYDSDRNLSTKTDARGITTTYTRDTLGRVIAKHYSDGTPTHGFGYQSNGIFDKSFLDMPTGHDSQREYSYDNKGQLTSLAARMPGSSGPSYSVFIQRDSTGNVSSLTYPDGRSIRFNWTKNHTLTAIRDGKRLLYAETAAESSPQSWHTSFLGDSLVLRSEYDAKHRETAQTLLSNGTSVVDETYSYTADGSLADLRDHLRPENSTHYEFDQLGRVQSSSDTMALKYLDDAFGNNAIASSAQNFDVHNQLTGGAGYTYDAAGDMTFDGIHFYAYNADGLITSIDDGAATYFYDAEGNLIRKKLADGLRDYVWMGGHLLAEKQMDGTWIDYVYLGEKRIAGITQKPTADGKMPDPVISYYITTPFGMTRSAVSATGTVQAAGAFSPFGSQIKGNAAAASVSFSDEVHDPETGLDVYRYRSYNPRISRWMSPDPSGLHYGRLDNPQTYNLYAFVANNPLKYFDVRGLCDVVGAGGITNCDCEGVDAGNPLCALEPGGGGDPCPVDACVTAPPDPPVDPIPDPTPTPPFVPPVINAPVGQASPTPNTFSQIKAPPAVPGTLTVKTILNGGESSFSDPTDGHAWLQFTTDSGVTYTYGTWGNGNGAQHAEGVEQNTELSFSATAARSDHLDAAAAANFSNYVSTMLAKGTGAWTITSPCSGFASDGWKAATGEYLDPTTGGVINNPTNLQNAINAANNASH